MAERREEKTAFFDKKRPDLRANYDPETQQYANYRTSKGFPLGGLGTGGFRIFTDGGFGHWATNHNWFKPVKSTKGTFFSIWSKQDEAMYTKILRRSVPDDVEYLNVDPIDHTLFEGKLPRFELQYGDRQIPLKIELNGFTPFIPNNVKDSSLPVALFRFKVTNPTYEPIFTSLLFSFQNILGLGGSGGSGLLTPLDGPVTYKNDNENFIQQFNMEYGSGIKLGTKLNPPKIDPARRTVGSYFVFCQTPDIRQQSRVHITKCIQWDESQKRASILEQFSVDGTINQEEDPQGKSGAIAAKFMLEPEQNILLDFYVVWWMPNHVIEKKQRLRKLLGKHWGIDYGHNYLNHFGSAQELNNYIVENRDRLYAESLKLEYILADSNLPNWLQHYLLNSADSLLCNSVLTKDQKFYTIEGVPWSWPFGGLTGTNDQRLTSHIYLANFYPELDLSELLTFLDLMENGRIPHGNGNCDIALGTAEVPYGRPIKMLNMGFSHWVDLTMNEILQLGRYILTHGDFDFLKKNWPKFLEMWGYLKQVSVNDIPEGITTYDVMKYEPCFVYTSILYLATLQMLHYLSLQMQKIDEDNVIKQQNIAKEIYKQFSRVLTVMTTNLWNAKGFFRVAKGQDTLFTGAMAGDWFSRYTGFKPMLEFDKVHKMSIWQSQTLISSHKSTKYKNLTTMPLPYLEANTAGVEKEYKHRLGAEYEGNYVWQSISYQACEAIYLGRIAAGLKIIKMIFDKGFYEGFPWDMDLYGRAGFVYMSHPVIWAVLPALSGMFYNAAEESIVISPKVLAGTDNIRIPVFFPKAWFMMEFNKNSKQVSLTVIYSKNPEAKVEKILYRNLHGHDFRLPLLKPFIIDDGEEWKGEIPN